MNLFISAKEPKPDSPIEERFGRSPYLVKSDTETDEWEAFINPGANQSGGAGVAAAQFVVDKKGEAVISGAFGPNAANAFRAAKIPMYLFSKETGTVQLAIDHFMQGKLAKFE